MPNSSVGMAVKALTGSLVEHVRGLFSLLTWEGREAATHCLRLLILFLGAVFFLLIGYLFLLLFLTFFLVAWLGVGWMWVALGVAVLHGMAAIIGICLFARLIGKPMFSATISEIKKDLETLGSSSN
ncbi:MAG: hypothetical protein C5B47_00940 [Verrucomicrobia bacterium]|nr:MAG: hypothetical protein C5B47_00940 [Verrucomicrobiota bacterium]